ncbi:hypothetical protein V1523DRAFT_437897 [Lipomyces doorenjongii]
MARLDLTAALRCVSSHTSIDNTGQSTTLCFGQLTSDAELEVEVLSNSLNSFIKLVDSLLSKSLNISMDVATDIGNKWGGMIFGIFPRTLFPRRALQSNCSTLIVHLDIVNEMDLCLREAIPAERRIAVAADVIGKEHVNILRAVGKPDISEMYYRALDFHGFYGSGKASSIEEEFYVLLYPIECSELKITPLVLGPFIVSDSRSDIDEDYTKVWDLALFLCDAILNHLSHHYEKTVSISNISSGKGAVGFYLYRKVEIEDFELALTYVEEAIPLIKEYATNCCPDSYHEIVVDTLYWGKEQGIDYSPFDIVIASDPVYDGGKTIIFLGYKPPGLPSEENSEFWKRLCATFQ